MKKVYIKPVAKSMFISPVCLLDATTGQVTNPGSGLSREEQSGRFDWDDEED